MPNLTSVRRLSRFYEDDKNYFVVLMVAYNVEDLRAIIQDVTFVPIEFLGWDCLTVGALGWGQIQIANNRQLGHRRTAFKDYPSPDRRRHLVRVWIREHGRSLYPG